MIDSSDDDRNPVSAISPLLMMLSFTCFSCTLPVLRCTEVSQQSAALGRFGRAPATSALAPIATKIVHR
jgi:hypothetical protein